MKSYPTVTTEAISVLQALLKKMADIFVPTSFPVALFWPLHIKCSQLCSKATLIFYFVLFCEQLISQREDIFARDEWETSDAIRFFIETQNETE